MTENSIANGQRLWDKEPTFAEAAKNATISRAIPQGNPQKEGRAYIGGETAPDLSTQEMKITLWGPPDRPTLSLGKTDVWDRRIIDQPTENNDSPGKNKGNTDG